MPTIKFFQLSIWMGKSEGEGGVAELQWCPCYLHGSIFNASLLHCFSLDDIHGTSKTDDKKYSKNHTKDQVRTNPALSSATS